MTTALALLREGFTRSSDTLDRVLRGLGDEEFFWEPVVGCWTVHRRSEVRAAAATRWLRESQLLLPRAEMRA